MAILTNETAAEYVKSHFAGMEDCPKAIVLNTFKTPDDEYGSYDSIDVTFHFEGETKINTMTVWVEAHGLYGEW